MTVLSWLKDTKQNNFTSLLLAFITVVGSIGASILASSSVTNNNLNNFKVQIQQDISNRLSQSQSQQFVLGMTTGNKPIVLANSQSSDQTNELKSFSQDDWNTALTLKPNKEGYLCPQKASYPYWDMWTKGKYSANKLATIVFSLLDKTNDGKNPTLSFSYGDKSSVAPDSFYRLNIFDGDLNTLRLYDRNNSSPKFERSVNTPGKNDFIAFKISPVFPNTNSTLLNLNPIISYKVDGENYDFIPKQSFEIDLPISGQKDQGQGFQYGIGVSSGDCFKIISTNF